MDDKTLKSSETVKMVEHAMDVLELLRKNKERMGVNQISKSCNLSPSSAFRILKSIEKSGWIFQHSDGKYSLGEKVCFLTEKDNMYLALKDVSSVIMERCVKEYSQNMNLMVREGSHCYVIEQIRTRRLFDYITPTGTELPFYASAGGKILLSELPKDFSDIIIASCEMEPFTKYTITDPDVFRGELETVLRQGFAIDNRESFLGGCCIAVPVRDARGNIIAALSFSGILEVEDTDELLKYLPVLNSAAEEITHCMYKHWNGNV